VDEVRVCLRVCVLCFMCVCMCACACVSVFACVCVCVVYVCACMGTCMPMRTHSRSNLH
jgi:hypothetical protein